MISRAFWTVVDEFGLVASYHTKLFLTETGAKRAADQLGGNCQPQEILVQISLLPRKEDDDGVDTNMGPSELD